MAYRGGGVKGRVRVMGRRRDCSDACTRRQRCVTSLQRYLGRKKRQFGGDLVIAAIAVVNEAIVATRNMGDFRLIGAHCLGLSGINPWSGETF
jgi:hypothetical protein